MIDHAADCAWEQDREADEASTCSCGTYAVLHTPLVIGLRAQGHIPTIERMLGEGASWEEIGREIGWCPTTAREWYERDGATAQDGGDDA